MSEQRGQMSEMSNSFGALFEKRISTFLDIGSSTKSILICVRAIAVEIFFRGMCTARYVGWVFCDKCDRVLSRVHTDVDTIGHHEDIPKYV